MRQLSRMTTASGLANVLVGVTLALSSTSCTGVLSNGDKGDSSGTCAPGNCPGGGLGSGGAGTPGGGTNPGSVAGASSASGPGEVPMRRLNNAEFAYTLRDLFGSAGSKVTFPVEGRTEGFDTLNTALAISPIHIDAYLEAASEVVTELFSKDPAGIRAGFCSYQGADAAANLSCAQRIVTDFAARAWRRPLKAWKDAQAESEFTALLQPTGPLGGLALEQRLQTALQAVLVSPRFIFRVELAGTDGALDNASLASRLSYFLWSSAPDAELLASDLQQASALEASLARAQTEQRFQRFLQRFPDMWLELEKLATAERDPKVYPSYTPELLAAMRSETQRFFADYWTSPTATVKGFLLAPASPSSDAGLTELYGSSPRLGFMTQAAIMTLTGATNRTSPVRRGKWVLERVLCDPPPPPPDGLVAALSDGLAKDPTLTERERLAKHRESPVCAACHVAMDPVGLGLENYDSLGAYRTVEANGKPIDSTGTLPDGTSFNGAIELIGILAEDQRLQSCVAQQLLTYGTGRSYDHDDDALLASLSASAGGANATFQSILKSLVLSDAFRRRVEKM